MYGFRRGDAEIDLLDPSARHLAQLGPLMPVVGAVEVFGTAGGNEAVVRGRSIEELLPALVRRIAWAGDAKRGATAN